MSIFPRYIVRPILVALVATVFGGGLGMWIGTMLGASGAMGYERGGFVGLLCGIAFSAFGLWVFSERDV